MFTYFHPYIPQMWKGHELRGLIDAHAGVRFCQSADLAQQDKFNQLAAVGSPFEQMIAKTKMPMYVDRLQGGSFWHEYTYDKDLLHHYRTMLGDRFYGFQMHEWVGNVMTDLRRIRACIGANEWNAENITRALLENHPYDHPWTEARSAAEYAAWKDPKTFAQFRANYEAMYKTRIKDLGEELVPCDSCALAYQFEIAAGAKHLMPEVGAQTYDTKLQIAYARGMARTHDIDFGVYYEPWGGEPFSTSLYHREGKNEWNVSNYGPFFPIGDNGGSSRSLQRRLHLYSYYAGADFISEEWSGGNTFYDWNDYELTPYGKVKYDFLQFVKRNPKEKIGTPYTPIAIVLSKDALPVFDIRGGNTRYMDFDLDGSVAENTLAERNALRELLAAETEMKGSETSVLINSLLPDAFDVIHTDAPKLDASYQYFVNCTGDPAFEKAHRCCTVEEAKELIHQLMPCEVHGNVHWMVNRTENGWLLIIFNHSGIHRSVEKGEYTLPDSEEHVTVSIKNNSPMQFEEGDAAFSKDGDAYHITVPAGGFFVGRF